MVDFYQEIIRKPLILPDHSYCIRCNKDVVVEQFRDRDAILYFLNNQFCQECQDIFNEVKE